VRSGFWRTWVKKFWPGIKIGDVCHVTSESTLVWIGEVEINHFSIFNI